MIDALLILVGDDRACRDIVIYALGENHLSAFAIATSDPFPSFGGSFELFPNIACRCGAARFEKSLF
jgi:hypothetical protein